MSFLFLKERFLDDFYAFINVNKTIHPDLTERAVVENVSIENDVIVVTLFTEPTTDHDEAVEAVYEAL